MNFIKILLFSFFAFISSNLLYAESFTQFENRVSSESSIDKLKRIKTEQLEKYHETKDVYYLYNSKYIEASIAGLQKNNNGRIKLLSWINENAKDKNTIQITWVNYHLASMLTYVNAPKLSQIYAFKVLRNAIKYKEERLISFAYSLIGSNYYKENKFQKAITYYSKVIEKQEDKLSLSYASMLNNIALCNMNLNNTSQAYHFFKQSFEILDKLKNKSIVEIDFQVIVQGNIGTILHKLGRIDEAIVLLQKEVDHNYNSPKTQFSALSPIIELLGLYDQTSQLDKRNDMLVKLKFLENKFSNEHSFPLMTEALYNFYVKKGDSKNSVLFSKKLFKRLTDYSNSVIRESNELNDILYRDKLEHLKAESNSKNQLLKLAIKEKRYSQGLAITLIVVFVLSILIVVLSYKSKKKNRVKDSFIQEQNKQLEIKKNIILENEIKLQEEKITNLVLNLNLKKNTEIAFLAKINELKKKKNISVEEVIKDLQFNVTNLLNIDKKIIYDTIVTEDSHKDFKTTLSKLHTNLSDSDLDFCCHFRLKLSAKEIGLMYGLSDVSVRVMKNKIKNKMGLKPEESINEYLLHLPI